MWRGTAFVVLVLVGCGPRPSPTTATSSELATPTAVTLAGLGWTMTGTGIRSEPGRQAPWVVTGPGWTVVVDAWTAAAAPTLEHALAEARGSDEPDHVLRERASGGGAFELVTARGGLANGTVVVAGPGGGGVVCRFEVIAASRWDRIVDACRSLRPMVAERPPGS